VAGVSDAQQRMTRASTSYESILQTGPRLLWLNGGVAGFQPLLDQILGDNHLVRVRLVRGARSACHTHDWDQVMTVVDGRGSLVTEDYVIELSAGTVVVTPRGVPHMHACDEQTEVEYLYVTHTGHDTVVDPAPISMEPSGGAAGSTPGHAWWTRRRSAAAARPAPDSIAAIAGRAAGPPGPVFGRAPEVTLPLEEPVAAPVGAEPAVALPVPAIAAGAAAGGAGSTTITPFIWVIGLLG
jgi:quercetin dioxygenase-like cupin family protein